MAFRNRARARAATEPQEAGNLRRSPAAAPAAAEDATPRAILARVKERARALPEARPNHERAGVVTAASPAIASAGLREVAADVLTSRELPGSDHPMTPKEMEIRRHLHVKRCPRCRHSVSLTHRRGSDRLVALAVPVHRWKCGSCGWSGLRVDRHEVKAAKKRLTVVIVVLLAFVIGLALMWFLDYLKYSYHPSEAEPPAVSTP